MYISAKYFHTRFCFLEEGGLNRTDINTQHIQFHAVSMTFRYIIWCTEFFQKEKMYKGRN